MRAAKASFIPGASPLRMTPRAQHGTFTRAPARLTSSSRWRKSVRPWPRDVPSPSRLPGLSHPPVRERSGVRVAGRDVPDLWYEAAIGLLRIGRDGVSLV